jgi:hypothetical protein
MHGGADRGHGSALTGAWPPATPVRQCSPAGTQNGEGSEGNSARVSPELKWHCGGRVTVVQNGEAAALGVTPTFYKNKNFVQIGVHIKMHIKL